MVGLLILFMSNARAATFILYIQALDSKVKPGITAISLYHRKTVKCVFYTG
jgi:hypothetical protein